MSTNSDALTVRQLNVSGGNYTLVEQGLYSASYLREDGEDDLACLRREFDYLGGRIARMNTQRAQVAKAIRMLEATEASGWQSCAGRPNQLPGKPCAICGYMTHDKGASR